MAFHWLFSNVFSLQSDCLSPPPSKFNSVRCAEPKISLTIVHSLFVWGQWLWCTCPKFDFLDTQQNSLIISVKCVTRLNVAAIGSFCDLLLVAELFILWSGWNSIMWKRTTLAWCHGNTRTRRACPMPDVTIPDTFPPNFDFFFPPIFFFSGRLTIHIQWDSVSTRSMVTGFGIADVYHTPAYIHWSTRRDKTKF